MAEENKNITTALAIVEEQQKVVGSALVAASGTTVLAENSDSSMQILEQIRDIQLRTLRGIGDVVTSIKDMFAFEKLQDRRLREDETEKNKENIGNVSDVGGGGNDINPQDADQQTGGMFGFLGAIPGAGFFKKMFAPILAFLGKGGLLVKLFGKFGPLGALILGFTLVYRYADDIAKALAPALDALKKIGTTLQPVFDEIMKVADMVVKGALLVIGQTLKLAIETLELGFMTFVDTLVFVKDLLWGFITGDLELVKSAFKNLFAGFQEIGDKFISAILKTFTDMINGIGELFGFENLIDPLKKFFLETIPDIFTESFENFKIEIKKDIDFAIGRFNEIFTFITDTFNNLVAGVKDAVVGIPSRIIGFVDKMFSPISEFFLGIGNKIKQAINGIIESLPLPDFLKEKMQFNITPSEAELKDAENMTGDAKLAEKIAADEAMGIETIGGQYQFKDGVLQMNGRDYKTIGPGPAEYMAEKIGEQVKVAFDKTNKRYVVVKQDMALSDRGGTTIESPDVDMTDIIGTGSTTNVKLPVGDIPDLANDNQGAVTIVNNNYNTDNSSVATQTDVHSGSLDTGIDKYHDKLATASA